MKREKIQGIIILILIVLLAAACIMLVRQEEPEPGETAVIETNTEETLTDTSGGQIRIRINPVVDIKGGIMNNLNFANYNEDRLLRCRILLGEEYIYDSGLIASGDMLKGDFINAESLASGMNEAVAEVYSYDTAENLLGQTNVKITLNMTW